MLEFTLYIIFLAIAGTYAYAGWKAAPWVPTRKNHVARAIALAGELEGKRFVDLGCGDGRLVCEAAEHGAIAEGYEISLVPYLLALWRSRALPNASIYYKSLWKAELSNADIVYLFLMPKIADRMKEKLEQELRPGSIVITYVWPMEGWSIEGEDAVRGEVKLYKYVLA